MSYNPCDTCKLQFDRNFSTECDCEFAKLNNKSRQELNSEEIDSAIDNIRNILEKQNLKIRNLDNNTIVNNNYCKHEFLKDFKNLEIPTDWLKDDNRQDYWKYQRSTFGLDEREIWSLDFTFYIWLYEHLTAYLKWVHINLDYHKFDYNGEILTQKQIIQKMLDNLTIILSSDNMTADENIDKLSKEVGNLWALVLPAMWS